MAEWDFSGSTDVDPGWYRISVDSAEERQGPKARYIRLTLDLVDHPGVQASDNCMVSGALAKRHAKKVAMLTGEMPTDGSKTEPMDLCQRTAWAYLHYEKWKGREYLRVNDDAGHGGYMPADTADDDLEPKDGFASIEFDEKDPALDKIGGKKEDDDDDIPF